MRKTLSISALALALLAGPALATGGGSPIAGGHAVVSGSGHVGNAVRAHATARGNGSAVAASAANGSVSLQGGANVSIGSTPLGTGVISTTSLTGVVTGSTASYAATTGRGVADAGARSGGAVSGRGSVLAFSPAGTARGCCHGQASASSATTAWSGPGAGTADTTSVHGAGFHIDQTAAAGRDFVTYSDNKSAFADVTTTRAVTGTGMGSARGVADASARQYGTVNLYDRDRLLVRLPRR